MVIEEWNDKGTFLQRNRSLLKEHSFKGTGLFLIWAVRRQRPFLCIWGLRRLSPETSNETVPQMSLIWGLRRQPRKKQGLIWVLITNVSKNEVSSEVPFVVFVAFVYFEGVFNAPECGLSASRIESKRALHIPQKSPTYSTKEPYIFHKRALQTIDVLFKVSFKTSIRDLYVTWTHLSVDSPLSMRKVTAATTSALLSISASYLRCCAFSVARCCPACMDECVCVRLRVCVCVCVCVCVRG